MKQSIKRSVFMVTWYECSSIWTCVVFGFRWKLHRMTVFPAAVSFVFLSNVLAEFNILPCFMPVFTLRSTIWKSCRKYAALDLCFYTGFLFLIVVTPDARILHWWYCIDVRAYGRPAAGYERASRFQKALPPTPQVHPWVNTR